MGRDPAVLLVSDASLLPGAAVLWAMRAFEKKVDGGRGLAVATNFDGKIGLPAASLDVLVSFTSVPGRHSIQLLTELARLVKSGGLIVVQEPVGPTSSLQRNLLLSGLVSVEHLEPIDGVEPSSMLRAEKPSWETGSSFAIKRKTTLPQSSTNGAVVKLPVLDMNADDDELIDEDELLTEEDLKRPELPSADDCEVGNAGRKACKNCTCGRAEVEAAGSKLPDDVLSNPQSSCGSCGLGDAFRCNTCPYRGLPPFKLGEKISLAGTLLTADV